MWKKLFELFIIIIITICLAEATLQCYYRVTVGRWLLEWWAVPIYTPDPLRGYRVKGNLRFEHITREYQVVYETNPLGFRVKSPDQTFSYKKDPNTFRVILLGPSFAFGWANNYEDTFISILEERLKVPDKRLEVMNLGTPSQPIGPQLAWLEQEGYKYNPDLILQVVFGKSESLEYEPRNLDPAPYVKDGYLYPPSDGRAWTRTLKLLSTGSTVLFYGWHTYAAITGVETSSGQGDDFYRYLVNSPDLRKAERIADKYEKYQTFVNSRLKISAHVVFLYIPNSWIVRPADLVRVAHRNPDASPELEREMVASVKIALGERDINFIDSTRALIEADKSERMYFLYDVHFTPAGNRIAAEVAYPVLQRLINRIHREHSNKVDYVQRDLARP